MVKSKLRNVFAPNEGRTTLEDTDRDQLIAMAAIAAKQLEEAEINSRFVPEVPGSKPTPAQQQFLDDFVKRKKLHLYARGGNQCLVGDTLVATPDGPRRIMDLRPGDYVLDPDNKPILVTAIHDNGRQFVRKYSNTERTISVYCTDTHKFLMADGTIREINTGGEIQGYGFTAELEETGWPIFRDVYNITVDHPENLYQLANGLISKNSGKTQLTCYLAGKLLTNSLPGFKRLPQWGDEPLLILYLSQNSKQIEDSIWRKMKSYLKPGTYHEQRNGGALQRVIMDNGNTLVFFTYHAINEARAAVQSFTAHFAFIDELPSKAALIEETQTRVIKNLGQFVCAFTPKVPAPEVKRLVETASQEITGFYRLLFDDNPAMTEEAKTAQHLKAAQHGEKGAAMILKGDWVGDELNVFRIDESAVCRVLPERVSRAYSKAYVGLDPANSSGFGVVVLLYDEKNDEFYVDVAKTLTGECIASNSRAAKAVNGMLLPYHEVAKIVCDPASSGFRGEARDLFKWKFSIPAKQDDGYFWRSIEIIQEMLGVRLFFTEAARDLLDEMASYSRKEDDPERVQSRKKYHMIDALRYLCSMLPKRRKEVEAVKEEQPPADGRELQARLYERLKDEKTKQPNVLQRIRITSSSLHF